MLHRGLAEAALSVDVDNSLLCLVGEACYECAGERMMCECKTWTPVTKKLLHA